MLDSVSIICPGLFYSTSAFDGILSRIRTPGGILTFKQSRAVVDFSKQFGDGYIELTNRANLQIRAIRASIPTEVLTILQELGLAAKTAGVDHLRNIMSSPTAGIDPQQLIDTRPLVKALDEYISNCPELAQLSPKFSIGFDGGEAVSVSDRPNDIWFIASKLNQTINYRLYLNVAKNQNIDTGILLQPEQCLSYAIALFKVYLLAPKIETSTGKKPRLRDLLEHWGVDWYLEQAQTHLSYRLRSHLNYYDRRGAEEQRSRGEKLTMRSSQYRHIGVHPQRQPGLFYLGVVIPIGRLEAEQLNRLADLSAIYGSGILRLTPWQNIIIPDITDGNIANLQSEIEQLGLSTSVTHPWGALVSCSGNTGCASSATDTKSHALNLARYLSQKITLDRPINIHFSGCPKSCAQHTASDIALVGTTIQQGDRIVEGYRVYVGNSNQPFGRELYPPVEYTEIPTIIERMLQVYQTKRTSPNESFGEFANRHNNIELKDLFAQSKI